MPPPHHTTRRRSRGAIALVAITLLASVLAALAASAPPVDAHGNKWGAAARPSATRFDVFIRAWDVQGDGHCAVGRLHVGGRWRVKATDCSHSPIGTGVGSNGTSANGWVSAAACITGHGYGSTTCHYGGVNVPFGSANLGNVP